MSREQLAFSFDEPDPWPRSVAHGDEPARARRNGTGHGKGQYTLTCADVLDWAQGYTGPKFHAMLLDGPYGLEFMGNAWDAPWKYPFSPHGYTDGAQRVPAPGLTSSRNPMCRQCHRHQRGWKDTPGCECASPDFDTRQHEQRDMEKFQAWYTQVFKALAQHLLPGAFIMAFASSRGFHRVMTAMEDAGLRLYPAIFGWLTGSSFPKATRIDSQIDEHHKPNVQTHERIVAIAQVIESYRERKGLERAEVSQAVVGTPSGACWNWEHQQLPSVEMWPKIKAVLDIPDCFDGLIEGDRAQFIAAEREVIGQKTWINGGGTTYELRQGERIEVIQDVTAPATPLAQTWAGHRYGGQMLKNSLEPIIVAQVPYAGKPVQSITQTGAGALNIDASRLQMQPQDQKSQGGRYQHEKGSAFFGHLQTGGNNADGLGRWPPNFALSHTHLPDELCQPDSCPVAALDAQAGVRKPGWYSGMSRTGLGYHGAVKSDDTGPGRCIGDTGGPSRFFHVSSWSLDVAEQLAQADPAFYCAKASRGERDHGLEGIEPTTRYLTTGNGLARMPRCPQHDTSFVSGSNDYTCGCPRINTGETVIRQPQRNPHPTVKPIALCRWLATLLLPPAAYAPRRVLVPFAGTGSEAIGALLAGWDEVVLVEQDANYVALAEQRLAYWSRRTVGGV